LFYCEDKAFGIIFREIGTGQWEAKTVIISDKLIALAKASGIPLYCTLPYPGQKHQEPMDKPLDSPVQLSLFDSQEEPKEENKKEIQKCAKSKLTQPKKK
jgi:hypothetical protein